MPAGVTWSKYLSVFGAALLSMLAGAQVIHLLHRPLDDLESLVQIEVDRRLKEESKESNFRNTSPS